jgi:protein SCO1/2
VYRFLTVVPAPLPVIREVVPFTLTNQVGLAVGKEELKGNVWVAVVIFSRCPTLCHALSQEMARLQSKIPSTAPVRFISLTADPETDTPSVLATYSKRYGADSNRWWFLTGPKVDVYRTAIAGLGFTVVENSAPNPKIEDLFIHSNFFALVDKAGRLRAVVQGERPSAESELLAKIGQLLKEP